MAKKLPVERTALHMPSLEEIASVLEKGLGENFADVSVCVVDCPDLSKQPFNLADKGLCGSVRVADIGGVTNLFPLVNRDKINTYHFEEIAKLADVPEGFILGAGAGPAHLVGVNSELMPNLKVGENEKVNTHCCLVNTKTDTYELSKLNNKDFSVLMNVFISEGKPGKVLEVKAGKRTGSENYVSCIRKTLTKQYGQKPVGLGGAFLLSDGRAKIHVMPDFSCTTLNTNKQIDGWLRFFEMTAPLVCLGYVVSHDPELDLRLEHFHCFSDHGDGGHYHYDTTPDKVSYTGYFNVAEYVYRIDKPDHPFVPEDD